ncbi:hypothetical protein A7982_13496 [Minicystis rosea]|nr:hypothetical protein A7982_13496 [Minicystis rosea]
MRGARAAQCVPLPSGRGWSGVPQTAMHCGGGVLRSTPNRTKSR